MPRYVVIKCLKKKVLKAMGEKHYVTCRETPIQITVGFSFETIETRKTQYNFSSAGSKGLSPANSTAGETILQKEREIDTF